MKLKRHLVWQRGNLGSIYNYIRKLDGNSCFNIPSSLKSAISSIRKLHLFCDSNGVLRVRSRLPAVDVSYFISKRHSVIRLLT